MIGDLYPSSKRTLPISLFNSGTYIGGAVASMFTIAFFNVGWQLSFKIIGVTGITFGMITIALVEEPPRGKFDLVKKDQ